MTHDCDGGNCNTPASAGRPGASTYPDLHAEVDRRAAEIRRGLLDGSIRRLIPFIGDVPRSDWRPTRPGPQGHNGGITPVAPRKRKPALEELLQRVAEVERTVGDRVRGVERVIRAMVREIAAVKTRGVA
jgi:hypothetical protein